MLVMIFLHPYENNGHDYLSMPQFQLIYVTERGPRLSTHFSME